MEDKCPKNPTGKHCYHRNPIPEYNNPKPYSKICCWCGKILRWGHEDLEKIQHGPFTGTKNK